MFYPIKLEGKFRPSVAGKHVVLELELGYSIHKVVRVWNETRGNSRDLKMVYKHDERLILPLCNEFWMVLEEAAEELFASLE